MVDVKVINDDSPWLKGISEVYTIPISHGEGRFMVSKKCCWICTKRSNYTQYIDTDETLCTECHFNPNQSLFGMENSQAKVVKFLEEWGIQNIFADGLFKKHSYRKLS